MEAIFGLLQSARFVLLRYETEHVPCTGITAVTKQERRHFKPGVMIAPWHGRLREAIQALANGSVVHSGFHFSAELRPGENANIEVLMSKDDANIPVIYLAAEPFFAGSPTPYDTPHLGRDALVFGIAVSSLLQLSNTERPWVSGADWESVPALALLGTRYITLLVLHNVFDAFVGLEAEDFPAYPVFKTQSVLQVGMSVSDVVSTVNQGFAVGLAHDFFHRQVMAPHLQSLVRRVVGIDNAAFSTLSPSKST